MDALDEQTSSFLGGWFARYGADPAFELEARVKGVDGDSFAAIRRRLESNKPPTYLRKQNVVVYDVWVPPASEAGGGRGPPETTRHEQLVRFSVSTEEFTAPPPPGSSAGGVKVVRIKTRHSFNHKGEVLYELTEVQSGADECAARGGDTEYEVELEWCGHAVARVLPPAQLAAKFVAKVRDLLVMKSQAEARSH